MGYNLHTQVSVFLKHDTSFAEFEAKMSQKGFFIYLDKLWEMSAHKYLYSVKRA